MKRDLGKLIIDARKQKSISQEELAHMLHVSRQTVSSWELGKTEPGANITFNLCKILDIDIKNFIENGNALNEIVNLEKKKVKSKFLFLIISIVLLFIISFIILITTFNSNKFKVYKVDVESNDFQLDDSILILSKVNNYFNLGTLTTSIESIKDVKECYLKIYEQTDKTEKVILETFYDNNIIINEDYGYNEYFNDLDTNIDNLYIDISYIENNEIITITLKIVLEEIMENDIWLYLKHHTIGYNISEKETMEVKTKNITIDSLVSNGYVYSDDWGYEKSNKLDGFMYNLLTQKLHYYNRNNNVSIDIDYYYDKNYASVSVFDNNISKYIELFDYYYNQEEKLLCIKGNCNNYQDYLQVIENELKKIEM